MLEKMQALACAKDMCVMATASDNRPHCSLMCYTMDDACREMYMLTSKKTQKYKNLMINPSVSLLIDTREDGEEKGRSHIQSLTITGIFQSIEDDAKKQLAREKLINKHPHLKEIADDPDSEVVCIKVLSFQLLAGLTESHFEEV